MLSITNKLSEIVSDAFFQSGYSDLYGKVLSSNRPDISQFQCNDCFSAAKQYKKNPMIIATEVSEKLKSTKFFKNISIEKPGFLNLTLTDKVLIEFIQKIYENKNFGCSVNEKHNIIIDYGGPNVAKPLHVGHLRSAIIGEGLKRLALFLGHNVVGDIHLGDWGLQMGMVISELKRQQPDLVYFDEDYQGKYPEESPITISDLEEMYPKASALAKSNPKIMQEARIATVELQNKKRGYFALWKQLVKISVADLKSNYDKLNVNFDLWKGESDSQEYIKDMVAYLQDNNFTYESNGALVVDVSEEDDKSELPPFMIFKSDGAMLYSTTDLATIIERNKEYNPDQVWYVVDKRQQLHFTQLFRCAYKTKIADKEKTTFTFIGFGTMNGKDNKPFKTRDGGVMRLSDLISIIENKAKEKMLEANFNKEYTTKELNSIASIVGLSALKFSDLLNHFSTDYIFDIERFSAFEGKTGPYIVYTTVRINSLLKKADKFNYKNIKINLPSSDIERNLLLKISELPVIISKAYHEKALNYICEYLYELSNLFNSFYYEHHILTEKSIEKRESWLLLAMLTHDILEKLLHILGISVPEKM